ncbi:MAG TPA: phage terminase large subunit [Thermoanaerobaculia bacterium]|nr:phage terminase large subunit [Thermoanaerobaculia bacterium]
MSIGTSTFEDRVSLAAQVERQLRHEDLLELVLASFPAYEAGWFHHDVADRLREFSEAVARRESPRLMLLAPPRHGKTFLASERFPVWHLGRHPSHWIMNCAYAQSLANRSSKRARGVAREPFVAETFEGWGLDDERQAVEEWETNQGGGYKAVGVGGSATGSGADILIIDDPVKNSEEAHSENKREAVWEWYQSTAYTRLAPGGGVLVIMTPWHEDDLAGRLIKASESGEGDHFEVVRYPAIAEVDEEHRKAGEALHPERFPLERLQATRKAVGPYVWQALYQCRPTSEGGSIWLRDWWRYWEHSSPSVDADVERLARLAEMGDKSARKELDRWRVRKGLLPSRFHEVILSADMSFGSQSSSASYCVIDAWARVGANKYLLDEARGRWPFPEAKRRFKEFVKKWPQARRKYVENKANGPAIIDELKYEIPGLIPVEPDGSKVARAHAVSHEIESGNVFLPDPSIAPWVRDRIEEYTAFPHGTRDDRVDTTSQALRKLGRPMKLLIGRA